MTPRAASLLPLIVFGVLPISRRCSFHLTTSGFVTLEASWCPMKSANVSMYFRHCSTVEVEGALSLAHPSNRSVRVIPFDGAGSLLGFKMGKRDTLLSAP